MVNISVVMPVKAYKEENVQWLAEAIDSVQAQTFSDWELIIVNDHSEVPLKAIGDYVKGDDRITACKTSAEAMGVAYARNLGASKAVGQFLLPMDHDDILPPKSMEHLLEGWEAGGKDFGVIYGDVESFGVDFRKHMKMPKFFFGTLMRTLIMPIGSLHEKSAWKEIGGWDPAFQVGLEDWEYWIRMTIEGHHGYHVETVTYHYRRHDQGRLARLRANDDQFAEARALIRTKHEAYYNGKEPKMCRGCGKGRPMGHRPSGVPAPTPPIAAADSVAASDRILVKYVGQRGAAFGIVGRASGWRYSIPGGYGCQVLATDGRPGVHPSDVQYFRKYDGGRAFMVEAQANVPG